MRSLVRVILSWLIPVLFPQGACEGLEAFTVCGRKCGTNVAFLPLNTFPEVFDRWLSEDYCGLCLQKASCSAKAAVSLSIKDLNDLAVGRLLAPVANGVSFIDALWRTAEVADLQKELHSPDSAVEQCYFGVRQLGLVGARAE